MTTAQVLGAPGGWVCVGALVPMSLFRGVSRQRSPNRRAQGRERAAARAAKEAKRAEAERKAIAKAQKIVAIWNARQADGRALWFYPTIGAASAAGLPCLTVSCPARGQFGTDFH
jgi:hypothetical protein